MPYPTRDTDQLSRTPPTYLVQGEEPRPPRRRLLPTISATADADGIAEVKYGPAPLNTQWLLEAVTLRALTTSTDMFVGMYSGDARDAALIDGLAQALAVGEYNPPRLITAGELLIIRWTGLDAGDECYATRVQIVEG